MSVQKKPITTHLMEHKVLSLAAYLFEGHAVPGTLVHRENVLLRDARIQMAVRRTSPKSSLSMRTSPKSDR